MRTDRYPGLFRHTEKLQVLYMQIKAKFDNKNKKFILKFCIVFDNNKTQQRIRN